MTGKRKTADEQFLADQVHRMRQLVDQLTLAQESLLDDSAADSPARDPATVRPLEGVRDYRTYEAPPDEPARGRHRGEPIAHTVRHDSPIGRRKR